MKKFLLTIGLSLSVLSWACLQPEGRTSVDHKGRIIFDEHEFWDIFVRSQNPKYLKKKADEFQRICDTSRNMMDHQEFVSYLIQLHKYDTAKLILRAIEKRFPNKYETASNLGTLYELMGVNDSALIWIKKGLELNHNSHQGSEWLHVKILEAKMKPNTDVRRHGFLIGHDFGDEEMPKSSLDSTQLITLRNHIYYQLNERMQFIGPQNLIVGKLLFELGNIVSMTDNISAALNLYRTAKAYGYDSHLMQKRYQYFYKIEDKSLREHNEKFYRSHETPDTKESKASKRKK